MGGSRRRSEEIAKRAVDMVVATVALALTVPVLAVAALAVLVSDGRPVLFRQERVGRGGQRFRMLKLRTMVRDAEARLGELRDRNERMGPLFKCSDDPRVTRVGRFLRASSIDELPQLLNVIRGEMSMVGPRPALPGEVEQFDPRVAETRQRVRPGITGLWQLWARDDASFDSYVFLDRIYVETRTLRMDLAILLRTVPEVLRRVLRRGSTSTREPRVEVGTLAWPPAGWLEGDLQIFPARLFDGAVSRWAGPEEG